MRYKGFTPDGKVVWGNAVRWEGLSCWIITKTPAGCSETKIVTDTLKEVSCWDDSKDGVDD